jgi:hypothetical protein
MARRFLLGALTVAIAAVWPACALSATAPADAPQVVTAPYASPALLQWTPGADPLNVSQTVRRAPGTCAAPEAAAHAVRTYDDNTTSQHSAHPGDGTWCFTIRAHDSNGGRADSAGRTVRIDTTPPTATVAVSRQTAGVVSGTVRVSGTSSDTFSGVAASAFHAGPIGGCATGPVIDASWNTASVPNGTYDVCNVATDIAGNLGTASLTVVVSNLASTPGAIPAVAGAAAPPVSSAQPAPSPGATKAAPKAPTKLLLVLPRTTSGLPTLRWTNPPAADLERVVVVLNRKRGPRNPSDGTIIYRGLRTTVRLALRAGETANVALYAYDHAGNSSSPARRVVSLASLIPLRPVTGSIVTATPLLSWKPKAGTAYYNIQIFHKGKRVLVGWPRHASYRPPAKVLEPGIYVWYVWPALKHQHARATFARLIGRATFVYRN